LGRFDSELLGKVGEKTRFWHAGEEIALK